MPLQIPPPCQLLPAQITLVQRTIVLPVQPNMLIQIARISKRPQTVLTLERLKPGVRPNVNLQPVLPRVQLPAIDANVTLLRRAHIANNRLQMCRRDHRRFVHHRVVVVVMVMVKPHRRARRTAKWWWRRPFHLDNMLRRSRQYGSEGGTSPRLEITGAGVVGTAGAWARVGAREVVPDLDAVQEPLP